MKYMRPQLMEDIYARPDNRLSATQRDAIQAVTRPQLQADLYEGITGLEAVARGMARKMPSRMRE